MGSDCPKADKPGSVFAPPAPLQRDLGTNVMPLTLQRSCQLRREGLSPLRTTM